MGKVKWPPLKAFKHNHYFVPFIYYRSNVFQYNSFKVYTGNVYQTLSTLNDDFGTKCWELVQMFQGMFPIFVTVGLPVVADPPSVYLYGTIQVPPYSLLVHNVYACSSMRMAVPVCYSQVLYEEVAAAVSILWLAGSGILAASSAQQRRARSSGEALGRRWRPPQQPAGQQQRQQHSAEHGGRQAAAQRHAAAGVIAGLDAASRSCRFHILRPV